MQANASSAGCAGHPVQSTGDIHHAVQSAMTYVMIRGNVDHTRSAQADRP